MKVKLQFFTAIASLALLGNVMAADFTYSGPGGDPLASVIKGGTAIVELAFVEDAATTNIDFTLTYDDTVVDEASAAVDCFVTIGLTFLNCSVDTVNNTVKGIGGNFSGQPLSSGMFATITLPTFASAATGDSTNPFTGNFSVSGVVTAYDSTWTLVVTDGPQPAWSSNPTTSEGFDFGTVNADTGMHQLPLGITNTGADGSTLTGTCSLDPAGASAGPQALLAIFGVAPQDLGAGLPANTATSIMVSCNSDGAAPGVYTDTLSCLHNGDATGEQSPAEYPLTCKVMGNQVIETFTATATPSVPEYLGTATLAATATSALPVTNFGTSTPLVCSVTANAVTFDAAGTCTVTAIQEGDTNWNPTPLDTLNITVAKLPQVITNLALADPGVVDGTGTVSATGDASTSPVVFGSSTEAVCTVSGTTVTYLTAGTCTVTANQAGDANYEAATQESLSVTVDKATQTITGQAADPAAGQFGGNSALSATASSGLAVTFTSGSPTSCTVSGSTVTYIALGTCTVNVNQPGDANYLPAEQVLITIQVAKADQAITSFMADPDGGGVDETSVLSATGGASGNTVTFLSTTTDICTVAGNVVTYNEVGTCIVSANQLGDDNYNDATQVLLDITVVDASAPIPTLSQWGLIAMFLMMLALGGAVIRRETLS